MPSIKAAKATGKLEDNAEELYNVMPTYNLVEYNENFSLTSRSYKNIMQTKFMMFTTMMLQRFNRLIIRQKQ